LEGVFFTSTSTSRVAFVEEELVADLVLLFRRRGAEGLLVPEEAGTTIEAAGAVVEDSTANTADPGATSFSPVE